MTEPKPRPQLGLSSRPDARLRGTLVARVQTAHLLKMREPEIAGLIREIESDPLFQKLLWAADPAWKVVRFQPHPRTRLAGSFYELDERTLPSGTPPDAVKLLADKRGLREKIRRMGPDTFERLFLRSDENVSPEEAAAAAGLTMEEAAEVRDFVLAYSVQSEFFHPSGRTEGGGRVTQLARVTASPSGEPFYELLSPHLARGRYDIQYDRLQELARRPDVSVSEKRRLRALIRRLELVNWRQSATFRIIDLLCLTQRHYFETRDTLKRRLMTQRQMARRLSVAPSTVNRAVHNRSLVLPWGEEALLSELFCSRKDLCLDALDALESRDPGFEGRSDREVREQLEKSMGFAVPRRTVNTYRRALA